VEVEDNGDGIAADLLPDLFVPFVQAKRSTDRVHGGLGIGLSLVDRLVDAHGGRVDVVSEGLGKGSRFTVRLPLVGAG
jgi:signal transduction histidine kinase